ncbi:MAG: thiamine phosphate synthase [Candidatus Aminicenantes bacterium]|nr:thiamine phosphate synthase [Candidatus Aminicenantes bacterium]
MKSIGRFHVLTDTVLQTKFTHAELALQAIQGGADTIQFRQKEGATLYLIEWAQKTAEICKRENIPFVVNDRLDVALAVGIDGIHLGQEDFPIPLARKLLGPDVIIGGSALTLEEAQKCFDEGCDYIGFGPVFPTGSKLDTGPASGLSLLEKAAEAFPIPIIAIGGIQEQNVEQVIKAGAYGIAVISAVCCMPDPAEAARRLKEILMDAVERS